MTQFHVRIPDQPSAVWNDLVVLVGTQERRLRAVREAFWAALLTAAFAAPLALRTLAPSLTLRPFRTLALCTLGTFSGLAFRAFAAFSGLAARLIVAIFVDLTVTAPFTGTEAVAAAATAAEAVIAIVEITARLTLLAREIDIGLIALRLRGLTFTHAFAFSRHDLAFGAFFVAVKFGFRAETIGLLLRRRHGRLQGAKNTEIVFGVLEIILRHDPIP